MALITLDDAKELQWLRMYDFDSYTLYEIKKVIFIPSGLR